MHESESEVTQSCLTLSDPMDCSIPGSSAHGIFQTRVLEWGAIAFSVSGTLDGKESACNAGDIGLITGHADALEKRMTTHSSVLAMDTGAWQAKAHRIVKS